MAEPEREWTAPDGTTLGCRIWAPVAEMRARVIAVHGLGCRAADFAPLGEALSRHGVLLAAWNLRGQGLDPVEKRRGAWLDEQGLLDDLAAFAKFLGPAETPLFLCGESLGALQALHVAIRPPWKDGVAGLLLFSPVVALAQKNPTWLKAALRTLATWLPRLRLRPGWFVHGSRDMPRLTRVEERQRYLATAPHRLGPLTLGFLAGIGDLIEAAPATAVQLSIPAAIFSAGHDVFTTPGQTYEFFERIASPDKTHYPYADSCHQLLFDLDASRVTADAADWLLSRIAPRSETHT